MKKKHSAGDGSLGWALSVLSIAFASLAVSILMAQNNELSERVILLQEAFEEGVQESIPVQTSGGIRERQCGENQYECLYLVDDAYYPTGLATVEGHYDGKRAVVDWDGNEASCDTFVVTGGSELLLDGLRALDIAGSSVVAQDMSSNIMLNINLDDNLTPLSEATRQAITASVDDSVEMQVFVPQPGDVGVPTCYSPFMILGLDE